jgi:hypothetical protein
MSLGTINRHDKVVNLINIFVSRFIPFSVIQPKFPYICNANNHQHEVDIKISVPRSDSHDEITFLVDVHMFNLGCPSNIISSDDDLIKMLAKHENKKSSEYLHVGLKDDNKLVPFVLDCIGNLGSLAVKFLESLAWLSPLYRNRSDKFVGFFANCLQFTINESLSFQTENYFNMIDSKLIEYNLPDPPT